MDSQRKKDGEVWRKRGKRQEARSTGGEKEEVKRQESRGGVWRTSSESPKEWCGK